MAESASSSSYPKLISLNDDCDGKEKATTRSFMVITLHCVYIIAPLLLLALPPAALVTGSPALVFAAVGYYSTWLITLQVSVILLTVGTLFH